MSLNIALVSLLLTNGMALKFVFEPRDSKKIHPAKEILSNTELLRNVPTEVSSWRHELAKLSNLREEGQSFPGGPKTKSLAVFVTGLQHRLLTSSKMKHVIWSAAKQGYDVDLYMSIVRSNASQTFEKQSGSTISNSIATQEATDEATLRSALSSVAHLAFYELLDHQEEVSLDQLPHNRLTQYHKNPALGLNVLRRFFANEKLFNHTTASGSKYDFILVTRDDDHWLGPLNLTEFESKPSASRTLFTKGCKQWGGVNDKTLLFGHEAAQAVLGTIYTDFFDPAPNLKTDNAETFLMNFAKNKGIELEGVPFGSMPTADSVYVQTNDGPAYLCTKKDYLCPGLPKQHQDYDEPTICPKTKKHRSL